MLIPAGRRRVTKRTTGAGHDRHLCAHGVNPTQEHGGDVLAERYALLRVINSSSSRRRSESRCRMSCRSP
jgi:hypothetical protein